MSIKIVLAACATAIMLMPVSVSASSVTCRSVGGYFNGQPVSAARHATLHRSVLTLSGTFNSKKSPARQLDCVKLYSGVMCARKFGPIGITVMTNGTKMVETVTDPNGNEIANIVYQCNGSFKM